MENGLINQPNDQNPDNLPSVRHDLAQVPEALKQRDQWVCWRYQTRNDKPTKIPFAAQSGREASSTDPRTWSSLAEVVHALGEDATLSGPGFVFAKDDGFCGVDLDNAIDPASGALKPWAERIVRALDSYTEVSPSGTGVKIFLRANKPGKRCRTSIEDGEIEIYDQGRYFTVTGRRWKGTPAEVEDRLEQLSALYAEVFADDTPEPAAPPALPPPNATGPAPSLSDEDIIDLARGQRRTGQKFASLYDTGDWNAFFNSQSEADSSVVFTLAFYTKDPAQLDRLFRASKLWRPKWDQQHGEQTYGQMTIDKALTKVTKQYQPRKPRPRSSPSPCATSHGRDDPDAVGDDGDGMIRGGTRAQSAATGLGAADALTTLYYYSEDLIEVIPINAGVEDAPDRGTQSGDVLIHNFTGAPTIDLQPLLNELSADSIEVLVEDYTNASAMATINPEGEISVTIMDGVGRAVISAMLDPVNNDPITWSTVSYDRVSAATSPAFGDTLETLRLSALNNATRSLTDAAGRTIEVQDAEGQVAYAIYDNNGNAIRTRDANGVGKDCDFDARNRDVSCTDTQGDTTTRTYNDNNQILNRTDGKGVAMKADIVYDARGRAVETTSRLDLADTNEATYDPNGNLLTQTDAQGGVTTYLYDSRNLRIATEMPGHNTSSVVGDPDYDRSEMAYDAMRRPLLKTDQLGDTVVYTYDLASRLLTREYRLEADSTLGTDGLPTGTIADTDTFTYDKASRPLTAVKGRYTNTVAFAYDTIGRPISESLTVTSGGGQTYTVGYTNYDDDSRLTTLTYPDGSTVMTTYTDRNQAEDIDYTPSGASAFNIARMTYDAGMRQTLRELGNGLEETRAYRDDNLLESITVAGKADLDFDFGYDVNKNLVTQDRGTPGSSADDYSFDRTVDAKDRLTNWLRDNGDAQNWDLSFEGDWDQTDGSFNSVTFDQSRTHNAPHEILEIDPDNDPNTTNSVAFTHDPKGNLTQDDTGLQLTFDFDNHLKQVVVSGSATRGVEGTHTYEYDALGRRIAKTVDTDADYTPDETTVFVYAGQQILAEYDETTGLSASTPVRKYIYCSTCYIDEPIAMVDDASGGDVYYYHRDRSYNVIGLTDDTGTIVELYAYTLYGERTIFNASWTALATSAFGNQRGFQGLRHDAETGLIENRARVLDPQTGRFLERDPLGYPDGLNTYAAYHVMRGGVDPSGLNTGPSMLMDPADGGGGDMYRNPLDSVAHKQQLERGWQRKRIRFGNFAYGFVNRIGEVRHAPKAVWDSVCFTAERGYVGTRAIGESVQYRMGLTDDLSWNERNSANVQENDQIIFDTVDGVVQSGEDLIWGDAEVKGEATAGLFLFAITKRNCKRDNSQTEIQDRDQCPTAPKSVSPRVRSAASKAEDFLGKDMVIKRADEKGFVTLSKDGTRRFRLDLQGHGDAPHGHIEVFDTSKQRWIDAGSEHRYYFNGQE